MNIYHNEIDQRCCEVLHRQFPDSIIDSRSIEDVQPEDLSEYQQCHFFAGIGGFSLGFRNAGVDTGINVWTGGFPCQDLSVAGKRKGLAGEQSGLYFQFHRLVTNCHPRWVVIENVPGLLSSAGGNDFAIVVGGLTGIIPKVPETGWGNAGFFRGPIYSVAYRVFDAQFFGVAQRRRRVFIIGHLGDGRAAEVLFEREGGCWDPPPSREAGQGVAGAVARGSVGSGYRYDANGEDFAVIDGRNMNDQGNLSSTLQSKNNGGYSLNYQPLVAYTIQQNDGGDHKRKDRPNGGMYVSKTDKSLTLGSADQTVIALQHSMIGRQDKAGPAGPGYRDDGLMFTLDGRSDAHAIAWHNKQSAGEVRVQDVIAPTMSRTWGTGSNNVPFVGVRRLTPTECARLQGFPDDWNAGLADSTRYRQYGNAVAVPVVEWIARRIAAQG